MLALGKNSKTCAVLMLPCRLPLDGLPFAVVGHSAGIPQNTTCALADLLPSCTVYAGGHLALWSQLRSAEVSPAAAVVSAGGVLDLCYADSEELGGGSNNHANLAWMGSVT